MKVPLNESVRESNEWLIQKSRVTEMIQNPHHWLLRCNVWWRTRCHSFAGITVSKQWRRDTPSLTRLALVAMEGHQVQNRLRRATIPFAKILSLPVGTEWNTDPWGSRERLGNRKVLRFTYLVNSHGALIYSFNLFILYGNRPSVTDCCQTLSTG